MCGGTGLLPCPVCTASARVGSVEFEVRGATAADVAQVGKAFLTQGLEHMASDAKAQAILSGYEFEREVAAIYRALGAKVEVDVGLAGSQIDILLREKTSSGLEVLVAVECKAHQRPVGVQSILSFAVVAQLLRERKLIDRATVVARAGFTHQARQAASQYGIELLELDDLKQRAHGKQKEIDAAELDLAAEQSSEQHARRTRVFVVMPFSKEFEDVYLLGIRDVAERLGFIVERADDIEHTESIVDVVRTRIRAADAVVGDTTGANPNVLYEIGYAHGIGVPTVLIARTGSDLPFDLHGTNHILYGTIVELRRGLEKRLSSLNRTGEVQEKL